jgi:hypothetical protein
MASIAISWLEGSVMRRCTVLCLTTVATCLLVSCNQPAVTPKPPAFQSSENTVRDWSDVAHRISSEMAWLALVPSYPTEQAQPANVPPERPVFIRMQAVDSAFVRHIADALESDILRRGGTVTRSPDGATVVNLDVNFVQWGPRDKPAGLLGTTLGLAAIPGIVIGASAPMSTWTAVDAASFAAVGYGALFDALIALYPTMNAEAVWQATIVTNDRVVMKLQEPVYIRSPDIPLYAKETSVSPLSSWSSGNRTLRPRTIRYDP